MIYNHIYLSKLIYLIDLNSIYRSDILILNSKEYDEFALKHNHHYTTKYSIKSWFKIPSNEDPLFRLYAAWECHKCNEIYYFEYDEETKSEITEKLKEFGIELS